MIVLNSPRLMPENAYVRAVFFMILSVGVYAVQDVFIKMLPAELSLVEILFFRALFGIFFIIPMVRAEKHPRPFYTKAPLLHLIRSGATVMATLCFIYSFRTMALADAYAITFSAPLFMTFFAILFLKERSTPQRWGALILGFTGVLVMFRPSLPQANWGSFIALAGGIFHAVAQLLTRKLAQKDSLSLIIISFTLITAGVTGILMPFYWQSYSSEVLLSFTFIGILGCAAQYGMSRAFKLAPVASIAPFDYSALLWGMGFDAALWHVLPDAYMICGVSLVIFAGLFLIRSEQKRQTLQVA